MKLPVPSTDIGTAIQAIEDDDAKIPRWLHNLV